MESEQESQVREQQCAHCSVSFPFSDSTLLSLHHFDKGQHGLDSDFLTGANGLPKVAQWLKKNPPVSAGYAGLIPGSGRFPEQSSILTWAIPWTEESGYSPWGCKRVGCDLATKQLH